MAFTAEDRAFMDAALKQAGRAGKRGEVPVGAVLVMAGAIVARGSNRTIGGCDPTAHAEMVVLRRAAKRLGNHRLTGATLYSTVEPCLMCYGAAVHARLERVIYGCPEPKGGAQTGGAHESFPGLNHRLKLEGGLEAERARALLVGFFQVRRGKAAEAGETRGEVPKWS